MDNIREYLTSEDPDYQTGVQLLGKHLGNKKRHLVQLLLRKKNETNVGKLRYELAELLGEPELAHVTDPAPAAVEPQEPSTANTGDEQPTPDASLTNLVDQLTPEAFAEVEEITLLMGRLHNDMAAESNKLAEVTSRADRQRVVDGITAKEQQYNALSVKKQAVILRGQRPAAPAQEQVPVPEVEAEQPAEFQPQPSVAEERADLVQKRNNLRSNISKARKAGEKAKTVEKQSEYAQKVGKLEVELDEVELQLKGLSA